MKVAVVSIATGKYIDFLDKWAATVREHFLPGAEKRMFVFTDAVIEVAPDLTLVPVGQLPWPLTSLFKFRYFKTLAERLGQYDVIVHMDMDMYVANAVDEDELLGGGLPFFGVRHPYWHGDGVRFFESNPESNAYIGRRDRRVTCYWQGCFWGGKSADVLRLIDECNAGVERDLNRHIIARWYDESHLNKFFLQQQGFVKTLSPSFAYPEFWDGPDERKIVHIEKDDAAYQAYLVAFDSPRYRWLGRLREPLRRAKKWAFK